MSRVHIALVGEDKNNVIKGIGLIGGSELYPITSKKFADDGFKELNEKIPYCDVHSDLDGTPLIIDPFSEDAYEKLVGLILDISQRIDTEEDELYINITGGTNLMSAAAMSGALLARATAYYVLMDNTYIKLPWHSYDISKLNEKDRDVIRYLFKNDGASDKTVCNALKDKMKDKPKKKYTLRSVRYSLKKLKREGYIEQVVDGRENRNELTIWGKIAQRLI